MVSLPLAVSKEEHESQAVDLGNNNRNVLGFSLCPQFDLSTRKPISSQQEVLHVPTGRSIFYKPS